MQFDEQMMTRGQKFRAFFSNFGKRPLAKIGKKMIHLTSKLGEINGMVAKYILEIKLF